MGEYGKNLLKYPALSLRFEGMIPGDKIHIEDGIQRDSNNTGYDVVIGTTGSYIIDLEDGITVKKYSVNVTIVLLKDD